MAGSKLTPQLGDTHLDWNEFVVKEREYLRSLISHREAFGQKDIEKVERSEGSRLYYSVLLRKLRNIYPQLMVKDGIPGNVALYRPKTQAEIINEGYDLAVPKWYSEYKYFTGFPKGAIPEWGHYINDTDGIAEREVRGYRSVLIAMVKQRLVTYEKVVDEFGDPIHDQRSKYWFEQLNGYMNKESDG